jgi:hypothetical protein
MISLRSSFTVLISCHITGCVLLLGGTIDAHVRVEGELADTREACTVRFVSARARDIRGEQRIGAGQFRVGFLYHGGERISDFHAELSCAGRPWRQVGPSKAFAEGTPVRLGMISP